MKDKKILIYNAINIKVFYDGTVSYPTVYTEDVLNTNYKEKAFSGLRNVFE